MSPIRVRSLALACSLFLALPAAAGDKSYASNGGADVFSLVGSAPGRSYPHLTAVVPIPYLLDPELFPTVDLMCFARFTDGPDEVAGAKVRWRSMVYVLDHLEGTFETSSGPKGRFKSKQEGVFFDFGIPSRIFTDGFESGDVSALVAVELRSTNRKRFDAGGFSCSVGTPIAPAD